MTKEQREKTQKIIEAGQYNKEVGCYVKPGEDPQEALKKAQKHPSYKLNGNMGLSMNKR